MRIYQKPGQIIFALMVIMTLGLIGKTIAGGGDHELARQAWPMIESGTLLVDVRTKEEFDKEHLDGAINIPWEQTDALIDLIGNDKQRQVVFYCRSGNRVGKAIAVLEKEGYSNIFNATGLEALKATRP